MARGGYREGAGRKKEYTEPVKKILLGLPKSVLDELDQYAKEHQLSRPKAVAELLKITQEKNPELNLRSLVVKELKDLQKEIRITQA